MVHDDGHAAPVWNPHSGDIYEQFSRRHMDEIAKVLADGAKTARDENRLSEVVVDGAIEFAFAPDDKRAELEEWLNAAALKFMNIRTYRSPLCILTGAIRQRQARFVWGRIWCFAVWIFGRNDRPA